MQLAGTVLLICEIASLVAAVPFEKRQAVTDAVILNYVLTLEHLEDKFYREGLANYTESDFAAAGFDAAFYKNLKMVSSDETTHVNFLTTGLTAAGASPVAECTYAFPATTPKDFVMLASVLEGVGVSAYLGAAASIMNSMYLTDAGSILTVESRHSAYIRASLGEAPFPAAFDTPLDFDEVYSLASQFIVSCPSSNVKLPVKAFPPLALSSTQAMPIKAGNTIMLMAPQGTASSGGALYAAFITVTGPIFESVTSVNGGFEVCVPSGVGGQSYVVLTTDCTSVTDENIAAGPAIVEVTV